MDEKEFRRFVIAYVVNLSVIALMVVVLILASNDVIPQFFRTIGLIGVIADVIWFRQFSSKYRTKR